MSKPIDITKDNFEEEVRNSDTPVVLDFWAPWCGPCRSIAPILERFATEYEGQVKVGKVNVDNEQELAQAFRVQGIPMLVAVKGGEIHDQAVGFRGEQPLRQMFDSLAT